MSARPLSPKGEAALAVAEQDRPVVPLDGKKPVLHNWPEEASTDPRQIARWWAAYPDRNIGVTLAGLVNMDGDPRNGAPVSHEELGLPPTRTHRTGGGGWHLFFRLTAGLDITALRAYAKRRFPGVDVKSGPGHQVVWPPSTHPETGAVYEVLDDREPVPFPAEWMTREGVPKASPAPHVASNGATRAPGPPWVPFDTEGVFRGVAAGERDSTAYSFACSMRARGVPEPEALALMQAAWRAMAQPVDDEYPLSTAREKVERVYREKPEGRSADFEAAEAEGRTDKPTIATVLVRMVEAEYDLLQSHEGEPYAAPREGPRTALSLRGRGSLRRELAAAYFDETDRAANGSALADALSVLEGKALRTARDTVAVRLAALDGGVVLDLGDESARAVVARPGAWEVVERSPVLFRRSGLTAAMPEPQRGGRLDDMRDLLNVGDEDWDLLVGYMVAAWVPDIPHPVLWLTGEQGVGKTSALRMLATLLDPSPAPTRTSPRDIQEWSVTARESLVICVDNVSSIPPWFSDAICRTATGDGLIADSSTPTTTWS